MFRTLHIHAIAWGLLLALPSTVTAAPKVTQLPRSPNTRPYDEAARVLGFPEWGEALRSDAAVHLLVRLSARDMVISINLPRSIPPAQAENWLQDLADAMGWQKAELSSSRGPNGTFLSARVQKATHPVDLGRQQTQLDLFHFRTQLARLTPLPQFLAVRTSAPELIPSTPARVQGEANRFRYAFYQVLPLGGSLRLTYGMGRRWRIALIAAWVAWALFPTLVFFGLRENLRRDESRSAQERWQAYQRWTHPVWVLTLAGTIATPFVLSIQGAEYLNAVSGDNSWPLFFLELLLPTMWVLVPAGLLGYPLSCELSAKLKERRFIDLFSGALTALVIAHALVPLLLWVQQLPAGKPNDPPSWWTKLGLGLLLLSPLLIGLYAWASGKRTWRRRSQGLPPGEFEASSEVRARVRELTAIHECAITRVLLVSHGETELHRGAVVSGQTATVLTSVAEQLNADQVAALVYAERLSEVQNWKDQVAAVIGISLLTVGLGSIAWMLLVSTTNTAQPSPLQMLFIAGLPLSAVPLIIDDRTRRIRQDQADNTVIAAMADPSVFLDALRVIERARMEASNLDPALVPVPKHLTERRIRLERRLGLE